MIKGKVYLSPKKTYIFGVTLKVYNGLEITPAELMVYKRENKAPDKDELRAQLEIVLESALASTNDDVIKRKLRKQYCDALSMINRGEYKVGLVYQPYAQIKYKSEN